jgi:anti-sigma regulatory factor (Ser/Thr protein kinase)
MDDNKNSLVQAQQIPGGETGMITISEDADSLEFEIRSQVALVAPLLEKCREYLSHYTNGCEYVDFSVVMRELLMNAIRHGNKGVAERTVMGFITHLGQKRFQIIIEDQGQGFEHADLNMQLPDMPKFNGHRGYLLISALSDRIEFSERGNRITVYVTLGKSVSIGGKENSLPQETS